MADIIEKKCAHCGKLFCPSYNHAFVIGSPRGHRNYFCKYTCMLRYREAERQARARHGKKYNKRDEVRQ